jgi:hypothetical protein
MGSEGGDHVQKAQGWVFEWVKTFNGSLIEAKRDYAREFFQFRE